MAFRPLDFSRHDAWKLDTPPRFENAPEEAVDMDSIDQNLVDAAREVLDLLAHAGLDATAAYLALLKATDAKARHMD